MAESSRAKVETDSVIEWRQPPRFTLADLVRELQKRLPVQVVEAYVFGSFARGEAHGDSDIDLLFVTPTAASWPRRALAFSTVTDALEPVDLVIYTPEEWARLTLSPTPFLQAVAREWVRIR